jgi:hypothetical protein
LFVASKKKRGCDPAIEEAGKRKRVNLTELPSILPAQVIDLARGRKRRDEQSFSFEAPLL